MKKIQKRLWGINLISFLLLFGINSTTEVCNETVIEIYNDHLKLDYNLKVDMPEEKTSETTPTPKEYESKITKISSYADRYKDVKLYTSNSIFIEKFIEDNKAMIKEGSLEANLNPANVMAMVILEQVNAREKRYGELAEKYDNWGSIKYKDGSYYSKTFKEFLTRATDGTVFQYDDCKDENGKRIKCEFYKFKSKWWGMMAMIRFLEDRINNHPQYAHLKGVKDTEEFAYGIYKAGYAAINEDNPHDKKIIRIIRQYDLENM